MSRNRIRLNICGAEFALTSDDSESYIHAIAEEVEAGITEMVEKNPHISITTAGIISALNYCDAQHKAEDAADNLRSQIKDYLEDSSRARTEADEARREVERLKRRCRPCGRASPNRRSRWPRQRTAAERPGTGAARPAKARKGSPPQQGYARPSREHIPGERAQTVVEDPEGFMSFFEKKDDEL